MQALRNLSSRVCRRLFSGGNNNMRHLVRVLPEDAIRAIDKPVFDVPLEARQLTGNDRVIGLEIAGDVRAYPLNILSVHEIVNDDVGGSPVCISWSPLSYTYAVYRRTVIDRTLTFAVSGAFLRNVQVMVDRETGTYWNQLTGEAFSGPLAGLKLERVPAVLTDWEKWHEARPLTCVLSKTQSPYGSYEEDHMEDYYLSAKTGIRPPVLRDNRLPLKEKIVGTIIGADIRAYPGSLLKGTGVLHDSFGSLPVVAFYEEVTATAIIYDARVNGNVLTFYEKQGLFFDVGSGSNWSAVGGEALSGPLQGKKLQRLPAVTAFWFAWADHLPKTVIYSLPQLH